MPYYPHKVNQQDCNNNKEIIIEAAHAAGCDVAVLTKIIGLESNFAKDARPIETNKAKLYLNKVRQFDGKMAMLLLI